MIRIKRLILFFRKYFIAIISFLALIISLFSLLYTGYTYYDKKINTELWINLARFKNLIEYEKRLILVSRNNSTNIINMIKREKGTNFLYENTDLIEYIFLTKVIYDLVNDSYEQFFTRINFQDIYNDVGRSINIYDVYYLSEILWDNNNLIDISYNFLDKLIDNIKLFDNSLKRNKLNDLLEKINEEIKIESEIINNNYKKALKNNNLEKELIDEYYKINEFYNGFTLAQKDWFDQQNNDKLRKIDSYLNTYLSSELYKYFIEELFNKEHIKSN